MLGAEQTPESQNVTITLRPDGVIAPALQALHRSVEVVSFCLVAIENGDLSKPPEFESSLFRMQFGGQDESADARATGYTNWLLAKGFQEIARGLRQMLEEAYVYVSMVAFAKNELSKTKTWPELQRYIADIRATATRANFPDLMELVNKGLTAPLHFESEFLSLQKVRNCLEHRHGVVGQKDVNTETQTLKLSLPRLKMFVEEGGEEVELQKGSRVEANMAIHFKNVVEVREFKLGESVTFKPAEFHDIGFGCWQFTSDLGSKLPKLDKAASNQ